MSLLTEILRTIWKALLSPRDTVKSVFGISLYRNTVFLVIRSFIDTVSGYVFWIVATRFYSAEEIGLGSAIVSAMLLIGISGTLGLGISLIRFSAEWSNQKRLLNSVLTVSILVSALAAIVFVIGLSLWSPSLLFLQRQQSFTVVFIFFVIMCAISTIVSQTIIAFRRNDLNIYYGLVSLSRLGLLIPFAFLNNGFGIYVARGIGETLTILVTFIFFIPHIIPHYSPAFSLDKTLIRKIGSFTLTNFLAETFRNIPSLILPIMVVNILGAESTAHFFMSWTIASAVMVVAMMAPLSLFAEGSQPGSDTSLNFRKAVIFSLVMLVPIVLIICFTGNWILLIFGKQYSTSGTEVLRLLTLGAIPTGINHLYVSVVRVEKKLTEILWITGGTSIGTLVLSWALMSRFDITGIGLSWLASQTIAMLVLSPRIYRMMRLKPRPLPPLNPQI